MDELNSCPFCGGKAIFVRTNEYDEPERGYFVCENDCIEQRDVRNKDEAIENWNKRI